MKSLNVYITFNGKCEEALNFYKYALDGEIPVMKKFGDGPTEFTSDVRDKIMHAEFKANQVVFLASDGMPGQPINNGNNIALSINFDNKDEQTKAYELLKEGGQIMMELQETFWGARFGMVIDKYGIQWMFNHELPA
jgi:PhnB protein